jgi:hypothetical protein
VKQERALAAVGSAEVSDGSPRWDQPFHVERDGSLASRRRTSAGSRGAGGPGARALSAECTSPRWDCRTRRSGARPVAGVELSRPHHVRGRCTRVRTTCPPFDGEVVMLGTACSDGVRREDPRGWSTCHPASRPYSSPPWAAAGAWSSPRRRLVSVPLPGGRTATRTGISYCGSNCRIAARIARRAPQGESRACAQQQAAPRRPPRCGAQSAPGDAKHRCHSPN